jgi:hypothetical protein
MAIRRCPYCKAIIDEQDKYCNNCGTQLLFPEDEFIEEEIPGDKIIDEEEAEGDEEGEKEDLGEERELNAELEDEEEVVKEGEGEEEEKGGGAEEPEKKHEDEDAAEEEEEELEGTEEKEADAVSEEDEEFELKEELKEEEENEEERPGELEQGVEEDREEEPGGQGEEEQEEGASASRSQEPAAWKFEPQDLGKKYRVSIEQDELVFKTKELEKLTKTVEEGKRELENFLESHPDFAAREPAPDTKEGLPPWVSRIRETPATVEPEEETQEEPNPAGREWTTDSGIGVPEKITQAALPFGDTGQQKSGTSDEGRELVEDETEEVTEEEGETRRPGPLSLKLRAKVVDWVFVTALWLISLWFTAQVVGVSFFSLIFGSPVPVLAFYVILLVLYFFLFLYFLGETPGDHYFSEED